MFFLFVPWARGALLLLPALWGPKRSPPSPVQKLFTSAKFDVSEFRIIILDEIAYIDIVFK